MSDRSTRLQALQQALKERILILDGGMGTMIQSYKLEEQDYRGKRFADWPSDVKGNNDLLVLTRPDVIGGIEKAYLDAGADILETNTFNATQISMADYGMEALVYELNVEGARLARKVADAKTLETRTSRASSPASWARPAAPARCRRTSTTPATATSPSTNWWRTIPRPPRA
ncbi:hypothetical protein TRE132_40040 [Pseudomonas chlororaphis subsp. aurantiaca]|nr:hypothetical protein TRE132_40040 [Pseudomonas chlororaphis subsp. aurantiaca]